MIAATIDRAPISQGSHETWIEVQSEYPDLRLLVELQPLDGPSVVVRVDPAPGFLALKDDDVLQQFNIAVEVGRVKKR